MEARLISSEGEGLEAAFEVAGVLIRAMDSFGGEACEPGSTVEVDFVVGLDGCEPWGEVSTGNPECRRRLEHLYGWCYRAQGVIVQLAPVLVDCGVLVFEEPIDLEGPVAIGQGVVFTIERLDAYPAF